MNAEGSVYTVFNMFGVSEHFFHVKQAVSVQVVVQCGRMCDARCADRTADWQ